VRHRTPPLRFRAPSAGAVRRAAVGAAGLLALAGCAQGPVRAAPPAPESAAVARICRSLHRALPGKVDGLSRRDTKPDSDLTAAWGSTAVVLRCGGPVPPQLNPGDRLHYRPTSDAVGVNGVDWLPQMSRQGVRFTTVERKANVEVWVPRHYAPGWTDPLVDLAAAVRRSVPSRL
jgi:Protein of unknown function (DUF3515)